MSTGDRLKSRQCDSVIVSQASLPHRAMTNVVWFQLREGIDAEILRSSLCKKVAWTNFTPLTSLAVSAKVSGCFERLLFSERRKIVSHKPGY